MFKKALKLITPPTAALLFRNIRDLLDQRQASLKTPWSFTLAGHAGMASGEFEPEVTVAVRRLLQDADVLVTSATTAVMR